MRRGLIPLLVLAMIVNPLFAGDGRRDQRETHRSARKPPARWQTYTSPYSALTYDFTESELAYKVPTSFGDLNIQIRRGRTEIISLHGPDEHWTVLLYETPSGVLRALWRLGDMALAYDLHDNQNPVMIQHPEALLCDPILRTATRQALFDARDLLVVELTGNPHPHERSLNLVAIVQLVSSLVEGLSGCQDVNPEAAGCYYDHPMFDDCAVCCEADADIFSVICLTGVWGLCKGKSCRALLLMCGGLMQIQVSMCISHNCRGKPGDPSCGDDVPCQGVCMAFCGPGYSRACGKCPPESPQQECCE